LAQRLGGARFVGIGGPRMAAAGCELLADVVAHASMGLDALKRLVYYRGLIRTVAREMARRRPAVLVPVDSPGLNWHMAAAARRLGIPVMYYVAPQVWAWAPWRIRKLRRLADHVACLLPFEQEYFRRRGVQATFVGHPMFDQLPPRSAPPPPPADAASWRIVLLPGSREKEIRRHAPAMVRAAEMIRRRYPQAACTFSVADERSAALVSDATGLPLGRSDDSIAVVAGQTHRILADSHFALATSGTITLETAYFGVPMVTFYRISRLHKALFGWLMRTRYYSLVNILAERELVPELIPWYGRAESLAHAALSQLDDPARLARIRVALMALTEPLREPLGKTASAAAAELVIQTMGAV
jgi:lipid-A-disaccharide synthase